MASKNVLALGDANFAAEVLQSDKPVLVDFWAEWCAPCRMIAPTLDALADEYAGRVKVGKINIENDREVAMQNGIEGIPTLLLFKGGQLRNKLVGLQDKQVLKQAIERLLAE